MNYFVNGTVREKNCDKNSPIIGLVLDKKIGTSDVFSLQALLTLSQNKQLWVYSATLRNHVEVRIFYSVYHSRYIATTRADGIECNNLLSLPIYSATAQSGSMTYYNTCTV